MEEARKLSSSRVQYGTDKLTKLNGKDILSQAAFEKQKMDYDRSHEVHFRYKLSMKWHSIMWDSRLKWKQFLEKVRTVELHQ